MIEPAAFARHLGDLGIRLATGVPDSLLTHLVAHLLTAWPPSRHVVAANEGAAIGIAMGHHLRTGGLPLVYLQNSGVGNTVNPLLSLADRAVYAVPMLLLVGWRGEPGVPDEPQHVTQGRVMTALLDALELPWAVLPADPADAWPAVQAAVAAARDGSTPSVLLVRKGTFAPGPPAPLPPAPADLATREEALVAVAEAIGPGRIVVSTTGMLSRELFEHRERTGQPGDRDLLTVGGMGHASSIALGMALGGADGGSAREEVWCLDGDGALLMHLGSLAVIAQAAPPGYMHVVVNNGVHDSVGGQPTAIAAVDVPGAALALGYRHAARTEDLAAIPDAVAALRRAGGPALLEVRVRPGARPDLGRPTRTPLESRDRFARAVRGPGA